MQVIRKKLVVVGDVESGKRSLLIRYVFKKFGNDEQTVFESTIVDVNENGKNVELALFCTSGQEAYDNLRSLSYHDADIVLICLAVDMPDLFEETAFRWTEEVKRVAVLKPFVLVGCKADLKMDSRVVNNLLALDLAPVTLEQGHAVAAKFGAYKYIECSAKLGQVETVFEEAVKHVLDFVPKISVPKISVPKISVPEISVPEISVPPALKSKKSSLTLSWRGTVMERSNSVSSQITSGSQTMKWISCMARSDSISRVLRKAKSWKDPVTEIPRMPEIAVPWSCSRQKTHHDFYISYHVNDCSMAFTLKLLLDQKGWHTFFDRSCIDISDNWDDSIIKGMSNSKTILLFITEAALSILKQPEFADSGTNDMLLEWERALKLKVTHNTQVLPIFCGHLHKKSWQKFLDYNISLFPKRKHGHPQSESTVTIQET
ncbi:GTP-binding protein Rho1, partial [Nowakowskiella sp. JEL0078]